MKANKRNSDSSLPGPSEDDPDYKYRIYSIVSYVVVLIIIGIPVWWMTTRVYRASLPLNKMYNYELQNRIHRPYGIPLSLEYDILITIVNPSPQDIRVELDGELLDVNLQPFLNSLAPVAEFTVKTQWLYLVDFGVVPKKVDKHFVLYEHQLPDIITPLEKKLWSHLSPRPCINLVLYVSTCKAPLFIYNNQNNRVDTNAFLSSRWGGITILNPDASSCEAALYKPNLQEIIPLFVYQLKQLLVIKGENTYDLQEFKQMKALEMIDSTRRTLKSLSQLLSEISSIVISDSVADRINSAVFSAESAEALLQENNVLPALLAAKTAFNNSEAAFSDPSLLALLYFPDDQKYAVYIPLFLPVMIPVLMSITTVRRWCQCQRKN